MNPTKIYVIGFAAACFFLTTNAFAGTTTVVGGVLSYAREVGVANAVYTLPTQTITRSMDVIRDSTHDFFLTVTLGGGLQFTAGTLPAAGNLALTTPAGGATSISIVSGGAAGDTSLKYFVDITASFTGLPTFTLTTTGWTIRDSANTLGGGDTASITLATADSATGNPIDAGTDTASWLTGVFGVADPTLTSTTAVVDVATGRLNFKATFPDTSTNDNGATLAVAYTSGVLGAGGTAYALSPTTDAVALVLVGSLDGIFSWTWNPESGGGASPIVHPITAAEVTAGASVITLTGATNLATVGSGARGLRITVSGITALAARTLRLSAAIATVAGDRVPLQAATLTTWSLNGTVLVANWVNGNTTFNSSRVYLWNPSVASGAVTVRVYSMPVASTGSSLLGTRTVGTLGASSGMNVRIKEDILEPLGLPTPFEDNGGNLTLEVTIEALGCSGFTQTFSSTVAYGTTPLTVIPAVAPDSGPCPGKSTHSGKHFLLDRECV